MAHAIMEDLIVLDKINKKEEDKEKRRQKQIEIIKQEVHVEEIVNYFKSLGAKEIKL